MTDNNKLRLAEQFSEMVRATLEIERKFYTNRIIHRFEVPGKSSRRVTPIVAVDTFEKECLILNNREHPFQQLIDKNISYAEALASLKRKIILIPVGDNVDAKGPVVDLEAILDMLLANAIIKWNKIQTKGVEYFTPVNKKYTESISKKAKELLKAIEVAPNVIQHNVEPVIISGIKLLAEGYGGDDGRGGIYKRKKLSEAYIESFDNRYMPKKNHPAANREFLIRQLTSMYMCTFGVYELVSFSDEISEEDVTSRCMQRYNVDALKNVDLKDKYWSERRDYTVHADVLVNLVGLIDDEFNIEDERTILRRVQNQRESSDYGFMRGNFRKYRIN